LVERSENLVMGSLLLLAGVMVFVLERRPRETVCHSAQAMLALRLTATAD
jgi:hypothetical protein